MTALATLALAAGLLVRETRTLRGSSAPRPP